MGSFDLALASTLLTVGVTVALIDFTARKLKQRFPEFPDVPRWAKLILSLVAAYVGLSFWGSTGISPGQLAYCSVNRAAPACVEILSPDRSKTLSANGVWPSLVRQYPPPRPILWDPQGRVSLFDHIKGLELRTGFGVREVSLNSIADQGVRRAVQKANESVPMAELMLSGAKSRAMLGVLAASRVNMAEERRRDPRVNYVWGFYGDRDDRGAPQGFGRVGSIRGEKFDLLLGGFVSDLLPDGGINARLSGPFLALATPGLGPRLVVAESRSPELPVEPGTHVWVTGNDVRCVGNFNATGADKYQGFGVCKLPDGSSYAGELKLSPRNTGRCWIRPNLCYDLVRQGLGATFDATGALLREGGWNAIIED